MASERLRGTTDPAAGHLVRDVTDRSTGQRSLTSETREAALARVGKPLADPTRCRILVALLDGAELPGQLAAQLALTR